MANALNWFELAATDINRAAKFYCTVLDIELNPAEMMKGFMMVMFPAEDGVGGGVVQGEGYSPSAEGAVVYLNGGEDLSVPLGRVVGAGGQVIAPKTDIGEFGFIAFFIDSEGNRVGLHSMA